MRIHALAMLASFASAVTASAADGSGVVAEMAGRIIARGHGATCSLAMVPVPRGGYYPCVDFGPYRVVREYGRFSGYVIRDGKPPYLVMTAGERGEGFVVAGPWEADMPARIVTFWNEVVDGGRERLRQEREADADRKDAEEYVRRLSAPSEAGQGGERGTAAGASSPEQTPPESVSVTRQPGAGGGVRDVIGGSR